MTMRRCTGSARDFGFTLIEAIIAITIIGVTFLPIMALISQSLIQLISVEEAQARAGRYGIRTRDDRSYQST